jgi:hypothetical protein
MDFTHALPDDSSSVTAFGIDGQRDERIYGLFPAFAPHVRRRALALYSARLARISTERVRTIVAQVPRVWGVGHLVARVVPFVVHRAHYLSERICHMIMAAAGKETSCED